MATLFGSNLAAELIVGTPSSDGELPTTLGGVSVEIDGRLAGLLFVSPAQINFLVPSGTSLGPVILRVLIDGSAPPADAVLSVAVEQVAPAIFEVGCLHPHRAAVLNAVTYQSGPIVSPAPNLHDAPGTYVSVYGTGLRLARNIIVELIDRTGRVSEIVAMYGGPAEGYEGLDQVNFQVPDTFEGAGVVELRLRVDGRLSNLVTIDLTNLAVSSVQPEQYSIRTVAGTGLAGYAGDGAGAVQAQLQQPSDVELGIDGALYIADAANHVVRRVSPGGLIETFAGTGESGSSGDGGLAIEATLHTPTSVATDAQGNIFIADAGAHRIRRVTASGVISTWAGTGTSGSNGLGEAATAAQLMAPSSVAVNQHGSLLIADAGNHRILMVSADGMISLVAGTGAPGDSGDGGQARSALLNYPTSLTVSDLGLIAFADSGNHRIRRIGPDGTIQTVTTLSLGDTDDDGMSLLGVEFGLNEELIVSSEDDHTLWAHGLDCTLHQLAGQDHPGPLGEGTPAIEAELHSPAGSVANIFGDIYLADADNHRTRLLWRVLGEEGQDCGNVGAIAFGPSVVLGGETVFGFVRLNCPTDVDVTVLLNSHLPSVPVQASVTIPAGELIGVFKVETSEVDEPVMVVVEATTGEGLIGGSFTVNPGAGQGIQQLGISVQSVIGGETAVGRLTLGAPAPAGGLVVELSTDHNAAHTTATVTVPEGAISTEFLIVTEPVSSPLRVQILGKTGELSVADTLLILPVDGDGLKLVSLVLQSSSVLGGGAVTATLTAEGPAPDGGLEVSLSSSTPMLTLPASITVPAGSTSVQFQVQTLVVPSLLVGFVHATAGNTVQATLSIRPPDGTVQIAGLTFAPPSIIGGLSSVGTVTLTAPAPVGGTLVVLASSSANVTLPATVLVPEGQISAQFTTTTLAVGAQLTARISATSGNTISASLTLNAGGVCVSSLLLNVEITDALSGNGILHATATLSGPAPQGGSQIQLVRAGANVGTIDIPQGQTSGSVDLTIANLLSIVGSSLQAVVNGCPAVVANITLGGPATDTIVNVTLNPTAVVGGSPSTGTVTIASPAPASGVRVSLSNSNGNATLPTSITIPQGQTSGQFTVTTVAVGSQQTAQITATSANSVNAALTINAATAGQGQIGSLNLNPKNLPGGDSSTGTVTLTAAAPAGGILVNLSSGNPNATTPASITIPQGQTSGQFTITTVPVGSDQPAQITATSANSVSNSLNIQAAGPGQGQIGSLVVNPSTVTGGNNSTGTVTLAAAAPLGGVLVNLSSGNANATTPANLTIPEGQTSGQFTITTVAVGSQQTAQITAASANSVNATLTIDPSTAGQGQIGSLVLNPTSVPGGDSATGTVTLAAAAPTGGILVTLGSGNANATAPVSITIPEGQTSGQFTIATVAVSSQQTAQITATSANSVSAALTIQAAIPWQGQIGSLGLHPKTVPGGSPSTATVTLSAPAPVGGVLVNLSSGNANATTPASITIPEGQTSGQFTITTVAVGSQQAAQITATSANSVSNTLTIQAPGPGQGQLGSLSLNPTTVAGGSPSTGTVTLAAAAPAGGILVNLSSGNANATTPTSITIPEGQTSGQFTITTAAVGSQQTAQITATSANSVNAALTINATTAGQGQIGSLSLNPTSVSGGSPSTGTVTLTATSPAGGILVNLSSGNANATTPASITIPHGQVSGQFTITTVAVGSQQTAQITATSANSVSKTLTINPDAACVSGLVLNVDITDVLSGNGILHATATLDGPAPQGGSQIQLVRSGVNLGTINVPQGQTSGTVDLTIANLLSIVGSTVQAVLNGCPAVTANITLGTPVTGTILGVTLNPSSVTGGGSSTGTVTLVAAAPASGVLVNLSSGNVNATVPTSIAVPQGQASVQFTVTTMAVGSQQTAQITATSANSVSKTLTINPDAACVSGLVLNVDITDVLSGNGILHATATLDGPAPQGGSQVQLVRSGVNLGTINVLEGQTSGSVDLTIANLLSIVGSSVEAVLNGCPAVIANITLGSPITGTIAGISLNPSTVFAGEAVTGAVTLAAPAGSNGVLVNLSTSNPSATLLSSSVVIPSGQTSTTFPINTVNTSASPVTVAITGTSGASSQSANLTINSSNPCVEGLQLTVNITNLVTGEGVLNAFVTLTGPAPAGGANVPLLIGDSQIGQVAIPANQSTGTVGITLANLPTLLGSVVRAVVGPCGVNATISLNVPVLGSLTVPVSLTLGENGTGTVTLNHAAPQGGATINLTKTPLGVVGDVLNALLGSVVVPSSVTIAEGQTSANFSVSSSVVGGLVALLLPSSTNVQIDAVLQTGFTGSALSDILQVLK